MKRKKIRLSNRLQRPVISDTLPFEVPPSFSNRHFCDVLIRYNVRIDQGALVWEATDAALDTFMRLLCGAPSSEAVTTHTAIVDRNVRKYRRLNFPPHNLQTMPFQFDICHRSTDARRLTVPHPLNQLAVAHFYNEHAATITYFAGLSPFSIRKPDSVSRFSNFRDRTHSELLTRQIGSIEEKGKEYSQFGSYFVYKAYSNVFKFFESYRYHRAEKRFNAMAKVDISKCFDSIYTHSLPWALYGKRAIKDDLGNSKTTFGGMFDTLMQNMNQNETNGIIIGPEFSRIFAELILQSVDTSLEKRMRLNHELIHRRDYEIFRYVDDYFIFFNSPENLSNIIENLRIHLSEVKLHINDSKTIIYEKPVITEITIAKNEISCLLESGINPVIVDITPNIDGNEGNSGEEFPKKFSCKVDSRRLIIAYKSALKTANVTYLDVGNYTFALLERKVDDIISCYLKASAELRTEDGLVRSLTSVMEFAFFVYASAPRVNLSIRIARIISVISRALRAMRFNSENKHHFFKYVSDNASHQLRKNQTLEFKDVENLYLLTALGELGKEYWLEEDVLRRHMRITVDNNGDYRRSDRLNYFSITVLLLYMRNKKKFDKLREFVERQALEMIEGHASYRHKDAETFMLALDILACPYVGAATKGAIATVYGLDAPAVTGLQKVSQNWFTTWGNFDLIDELDAKRSREVY